MVFESPELVASCCTFCFACDGGVSTAAGATFEGVEGPDTVESGVAARGRNEVLRDGVNGAEVGTIREDCFATNSSRIIGLG